MGDKFKPRRNRKGNHDPRFYYGEGLFEKSDSRRRKDKRSQDNKEWKRERDHY